jgi:hypothetical protein
MPVFGDRIEATGDRNMLGYAARVATRFMPGSTLGLHPQHFAIIQSCRPRRSTLLSRRTSWTHRRCTDEHRSPTRRGLECSACVQKSKPAMESLGKTGPSASDLGQVLSVTPCSHQRGRTPPPDSSAPLTSCTHREPAAKAHRRVNEMQPSQSAAAEAAPKSGTATSGH